MLMNYTEEERRGLYARGSHQENILFASFYILVFIMAVPGNALALWAFCRQGSTSPSNVFLSNLAIADVSYVLVLPARVAYHLSDSHWPFGQIPCRLIGFLFYLNVYCSLYFMSSISIDRFLALVFPLRSRSFRKAPYAKVIAAFLWVVVIVSMCPLLLSNKPVIVEVDNLTMCNQIYLENPSPKALVSTVVAFVIPLVTIVVCYISIVIKLRRLTQQEERPVRDKAIRMIIVIMVNFLVAFMPYWVSRIIYIERQFHGHMTDSSIETLVKANRITSAMTCVSGVLNPVMYFFLARVYQDMLLNLFCKGRVDT